MKKTLFYLMLYISLSLAGYTGGEVRAVLMAAGGMDGYPDSIPAADGEIPGNILGYTLWRTTGNMWYERDPDYLTDESAAGHGIFVSEHICVSEVFLGSFMREVIENRGTPDDTQRGYFTEWGMHGLEKTAWEMLEEGWQADPYKYLRSYEVNTLFGSACYDFSYIFFDRNGKGRNGNAQILDVQVSVDGNGKINRVEITVEEIPAGVSGMEYYVNVAGLYAGGCGECVVKDGKAEEGRILLEDAESAGWGHSRNQEAGTGRCGLLESGDAAVSAAAIGEIWTDILESRGKNLRQYRELFGDDSVLGNFTDGHWEQTDGGWKADSGYDCYYMDMEEETGQVLFQYYFYPDYNAMDVDTAEAVILECGVDGNSGKIFFADMKIFSMTEEEYRLAKQGNENRYELLVDKGNIVGGDDSIRVPVPGESCIPMPLNEFSVEKYREGECGIEEREAVIWGCGSVADAASYLGEHILSDIKEGDISHGETEKMLAGTEGFYDGMYLLADAVNEGWRAEEDYDCFFIGVNKVAECLHFRYYFYPQAAGGKTGADYVVVLDTYVSARGIEKMQVRKYRSESGKRWRWE